MFVGKQRSRSPLLDHLPFIDHEYACAVLQ